MSTRIPSTTSKFLAGELTEGNEGNNESSFSSILSCILFLMTLLLLPLAAPAADAITETFQRALFEEEANQNLDAAIRTYQDVIGRMGEQRKLAATAVFRLGECYRKLGQTNEATAQYRRVLTEFADQTVLVNLSRQNLAGLGATAASTGPAAGPALPDADSETIRVLERQLAGDKTALIQLTATVNQLTNLKSSELKRTLPVVTPDSLLSTLMELELKTQLRITDLKQQYGDNHPEVKGAVAVLEKVQAQSAEQIDGIMQGLQTKLAAQKAQVDGLSKELEQLREAAAPAAPALPAAARQEQRRLLEEEIKLVEEQLASLNKMYSVGRATRDDLRGKEREILALRRQLAGIAEGPSAAAGSGPAGAASESEEDKEIRRLQTMIQNSPDLINARETESSYTPLHKAARLGQARVVGFLLTNRADLTVKSGGYTALHFAAQNGHKAVVELLLQHGANVAALTDQRQTPLHLATERGFRLVAEVLIAHQAPLDAAAQSGATPLHTAVLNGFASLAELFIAKGADVNANQYRSPPSPGGSYGGVDKLRVEGAPLHLAANSGNTGMVSRLLTAKATVDLPNASGHTPLHFAAGLGHLGAAELLLQAGANPNAEPLPDKNPGWTPLHMAVQADQKDMVALLLKYKAKTDVQTGTSFEGDGGPGWTPLLMAAAKGNIEIARLLLQSKADPNGKEQGNTTALWKAVSFHNQPLAELLLNNGADPNLRAWDEYTCLHKAVELRNQALSELLLARHADPNLTNKYGQTPLHLIVNAARSNPPRPGLPIPATPRPGYYPATPVTPPSHPARPPEAKLVDLARLLLEHGADVNARDAQGMTPLNLLGVPPKPQTETQTTLAQLLRERGAVEGVPEPPQDPAVIRAWRDGLWKSQVVFTRDTNGLSRFKLFDALMQFYFSTAGSGGTSFRPVIGNSEDRSYDFPDLRRLEIRRPDGSGKYRRIAVDLLDATNGVDCARNLDLEFGDVIVIPEREHALNENAAGMLVPDHLMLGGCIKRMVRFMVKGQSRELAIYGGYGRSLSAWLTRSEVMSVLVSSSDLSRVMVRRRTMDKAIRPITTPWLRLTVPGPATQPGELLLEFKVDVNGFRRSGLPASEDLLLRDGDEIEVPERE